MSIPIVVFIFGGILLLIGILGGGFEVRELKVPKVGWVPRLMATIGGVFFVLWGANMTLSAPLNDTRSPTPVEFTIEDELGQNQVSEQVTIVLNGKVVGQLTINEDYPKSMISVRVSQAGQYSYTADATAVFDVNSTRYSYSGAGQGMIEVKPGKKFAVQGSATGDTWLVALVEE